MNGIFKNYSDDKLFQLFLYPYIKKDTLLRITETTLVSRVSLFLYEWCREIEDVLMSDIKDKYVMEIVPVRQSVLWNENENNSFKVVPSMSIEEFASDALFLSISKRVSTLVFDLVSNAKAGSPDFDILSKDEKFMRILRKTKTEFINQYEMIVKEQKTTSYS